MGNMGGARAARTMTWSLDKRRNYSTMHSTCLTMGTRPPPPLSLSSSPLEAPTPLQRNVEDDVFDGGNTPVGAVYRGQGRQLGGRAIQSAIVCDAAIGGGGHRGGGGGRASGHRTVEATNYKRWGWDRSSDVRTLFEGEPATPSRPLCVETSNKQGECVLKISVVSAPP